MRIKREMKSNKFESNLERRGYTVKKQSKKNKKKEICDQKIMNRFIKKNLLLCDMSPHCVKEDDLQNPEKER
jgi:hypothetical protein